MPQIKNRFTFTCLQNDKDNLNKLFEECLSFIAEKIINDKIEGFIYCKKNYSQKYLKTIVPSISLKPVKDMDKIYEKYYNDDYSKQGHLNDKFKPPIPAEDYVFERLIRDLNPLEKYSISDIMKYLVLFSMDNGDVLSNLFLEYGNVKGYAERMNTLYHKKQLQIEDVIVKSLKE